MATSTADASEAERKRAGPEPRAGAVDSDSTTEGSRKPQGGGHEPALSFNGTVSHARLRSSCESAEILRTVRDTNCTHTPGHPPVFAWLS